MVTLKRTTGWWMLALLLAAVALAAEEGQKLGDVTVADVSVAGLTVDEARAKLAHELADKLKHPVTLTDGSKSATRTRGELGASLNLDGMLERAKGGESYVPLLLKVDCDVAAATLRKLAPQFAFAGTDAKPYVEDGEFHVRPGAYSRAVDISGTSQELAGLLQGNAAIDKVALVLNKKPPRLTTEAFAGIDGEIGRYTTKFDPGQVARTKNMSLAIRAINGTLIAPGEVFSLNNTVGERTPQRGYQKAKIFVNGQIEQGYGGGVSQVTGTLFNAALVGGLQILTYRVHSRPVAYLPFGRDATVAWGSFDMKFKNNTPAPLYIDYRMEGRTVTATLFGKQTPGYSVTIDVTSRKLGPNHVVATLYRTIKIDGEGDKQLVGRSEYQWRDENAD